MSYLGFLIGESGIRCNKSKVEAISKITTPTSIEEVRHFNSMCSYYRKFISHYSDITKCFNDMMKKGAVFKWTKECDNAFKGNITEKEAYTIYKSIKRFAFYITGAKTTVFGDHKPLKNFFEGGMNIAKLDKWSLELQEFNISLEFIQGKLNKIADVISRLKNEGLYAEHSNEKSASVKINLQDRRDLGHSYQSFKLRESI